MQENRCASPLAAAFDLIQQEKEDLLKEIESLKKQLKHKDKLLDKYYQMLKDLWRDLDKL